MFVPVLLFIVLGVLLLALIVAQAGPSSLQY
jgi:hypothetical protein